MQAIASSFDTIKQFLITLQLHSSFHKFIIIMFYKNIPNINKIYRVYVEGTELYTNLFIEMATDEDGIVIIATGPLTSEKLAKQIGKLTGEDKLYFYDAAAPIITKDSIDYEAFDGSHLHHSRYRIQCPLSDRRNS